MIYLAFAALVILCVALPVVAVLVTLQMTLARETANEKLFSITAKLIEEQTRVIARQQKVIDQTHSRLVLPMERAAADVANAHERQPISNIPLYTGDIPDFPDLATAAANLPNDLDVSPDDL